MTGDRDIPEETAAPRILGDLTWPLTPCEQSMGISSNSLHSLGMGVMSPLLTHLLESGIVVQIC